MKVVGVVIGFLLIAISGGSEALDKKVVFDADLAWGYIEELAKDSMLGRKSGHPGGVMAEEYIASMLEEWGVEPAGDDGTYFQTFTFPYWNLNEGTVLEIRAGSRHRDFYYGEDWRVQKFSGSGQYTAEVVFVGYGIHAPKKGYDDYEGIDAKGKLVLFRTGAPKKLMKKVEEEADIVKRIGTAYEYGAKGVMIFQEASGQPRRLRVRLKKENYRPDFVILTAESKVTDFIVRDLDGDLRTPFRDIDKTSKPQSFATGVKAFVSVDVEFDPERKTRNVLGKITGSDGKMKHETVVVGGHWDHLGVSSEGEIYNGANDNASGTAVTMEIARVMKLSGAKPKRTVLFGLWAAEESGLLGSKHYCDHPTLPFEQTVTYFNMDMVAHGTGKGKVRFMGEYYGPRVWETVKARLPEEMAEYVEPGRGGPGGSDHSPFLAKGVPAYFTISSGPHLKYHHVRDDADLVNRDTLQRIGDAVYAAVNIMADAPGDFVEPRRYANYHLKVQNLVNYRLSGLNEVIEHHGDTEKSHVDIQLAVVPENEELTGDELRVDMVESLLAASDSIAKAKGLVEYTTAAGVNATVRQGKTTLIPGLVGVRSFEDDLAWAKVLAKTGAHYVFLEDSSMLFEGDALSEKGKGIIEASNKGGLLLMVGGTNASQATALLEFSKKPIVLLETEVPAPELMTLVKDKNAAVALVLKETTANEFFKKVGQLKEFIGTKYVMIVNEDCVRHEAGKTAMLDVVAEFAKADYEREDFANIFSGTFLRILDEARDVGPKPPPSGRPF
jgi:microsomal dipeptidase-like Zn-dependent dipeptidase